MTNSRQVMNSSICFIVNVDWFFDSHRRPLERRLATIFNTSVIAGYSGLKVNYRIDTFEIKSRVPTLRGIYQLYKKVRCLGKNVTMIVVSPVMIILCHFLFPHKEKMIYNFSGLGFLRNKSSFVRNLIIKLIKIYPVSGHRVFIVQNSDDYKYLNEMFGSMKNYDIEIIAGSGYEDERDFVVQQNHDELLLGYVGRIRKDKGVLDLIKAVEELKKNGYKIHLKIWGDLDDHGRHGFNKSELNELKNYNDYFQGFSKNKIQIFSSFNWFCLPSNGEGLSRAAIEAASFGLPLLLSNVQGNRDMIQGNGFLFEYGDVENLKKVLIDVSNLSKRDYRDMSEMSRSMFKSNWTIESIFNKWKETLIKYDTLST